MALMRSDGDVRLFDRSRTRRLPLKSGNCAGHGFPLRHCADAVDGGGESGVLPVRRDEKISDC